MEGLGRGLGCRGGCSILGELQESGPQPHPRRQVGGSPQPNEGPRGQGLRPARQVSGPSQWCTWRGRRACPFSAEQSLLCSRRPSGLQGREDWRAADGPRVSDFQSGVGRGQPWRGKGRGSGSSLPPPSRPSQPLIPTGKQGSRWEGQGGRGEVGGGTVCPPPLPSRAGWRGDRPQPGLS